MLELSKIIRPSHLVACFNFFSWFMSKVGRRSVQSYEKLSFVSVFSRLGPFPQVSGQVKKWLMLELQKIIRMSHVVPCPIVFILFYY